MATKSVGPNLYGGAAEFTRARAFLLVGVVSVLGLIMGVSWTVVRNDPASSDLDASQGSPFVFAPAAVNGLRPARVRMFRPHHAVLPTVARTPAPAGATIEPIAPVLAASQVQPSAPATSSAPAAPSAPVTPPTTVAPPAPAVASTPAPPTSAAPPPAAPQPAAASVATPTTSPPVPAAVATPAPPAPVTPAVVAPASAPAGPTNGGRGDDGPSKDDSRRGDDRDEKSRSDNDRAREQLEQARQAVNELLAKAQAKLDDLVKSNRGRD